MLNFEIDRIQQSPNHNVVRVRTNPMGYWHPDTLNDRRKANLLGIKDWPVTKDFDHLLAIVSAVGGWLEENINE